MKKVILSWSGGKDAAMALLRLQQQTDVVLVGLLTTKAVSTGRVSMHGVRVELIEAQAAAIGLPVMWVSIPENSAHAWETAMLTALTELNAQGITHIAHGDIFLEDLRHYRDELLKRAGLQPLYPLWGENTRELLQSFFDQEFRAIMCCVSDQWFGETDAGCELNPEFMHRMPAAVDPCGENGEFHTFCYAGPIFRAPIAVQTGECIYKALPLRTQAGEQQPQGFWYADLLAVPPAH